MIICSNHQEYQVPLIYTFSWAYNEYWCPYCDKHEGAMGAGEDVEETEELKKRLELFKEASEEYRNELGTLICESTMWNGVRTKPDDLPEEEKNRLEEIRKKGWELNKKIEDLK